MTWPYNDGRRWIKVFLPVSVYDACVAVAFAKNCQIRQVMERLFTGALDRRKEIMPFFPLFNHVTKGIRVLPKDLAGLRKIMPQPPIVNGVPWCSGHLIEEDLKQAFTADHGDLQWVVLDLVFFRPQERPHRPT